jgi:hypothetical protein
VRTCTSAARTSSRTLSGGGLPQLAERAAQELAEDFDGVQAVDWCQRVGISLDDLFSRVGGRP